MSRSLPEWHGATSDTTVPPRVRLRVFERDNGICQCGCGRKVAPGEKWETDHKIALVNGGENRENNLVTLLELHHTRKTGDDVAEKSKVYKQKLKHRGIRKKSKFACSRDSPWRKKIDGTVVRR